jgi:methionyl-tRNA formyltransferase
MGTPEFALPAFKALADDPSGRFTISLVLSRPDAPTGRGLKTTPSIISAAATERGLELAHPETLRGPDFEAILARIAELEIDIGVVTAYGMMLTETLINAPRLGTVNIHASLLPRWRGAAPIERAILAGDTHTGVSIQQVRRQLDSGPVYSHATTLIGDKPYDLLLEELGTLGAELLANTLPGIASGELKAVEQDTSLVTYAEKLSNNELALDPKLSTTENLRRIQAASRRFPARTLIAGRGVRILSAALVSDNASTHYSQAFAAPASQPTPTASATQPAPDTTTTASQLQLTNMMVSPHTKRLQLQTTDGWLEIHELIPDGKGQMGSEQFARGLQLPPNDPQFTWSKLH